MEELGDLVRLFAEKFEEQKRAQNMIDFSDMEQYALRILTEKTEAGLGPSKIAEEYQKQFQEIMIDEYQDSNLIQEAILTSVSTVSRGSYNVFMVGDVKQSIYRFRLSRPELFMEKYDTYSQADSEKQRIDLDRNFRSRKEVLDATNYVFEQIMHKSVGGVEYDARAALYPGADYPKSRGAKRSIGKSGRASFSRCTGAGRRGQCTPYWKPGQWQTASNSCFYRGRWWIKRQRNTVRYNIKIL